jgi:tetratricopeptide (TPR) repeat protein
MRSYSNLEAYSFYKETLATLGRLPETEERKKQELDVLVLAVTPLHLLGYPEGSLNLLHEGEALSKELRDSRRLAFFYSRLSAYHTFRGSHLLAVQYSENALEEGWKSEDIDLIVPVAQGLCLSYMSMGQLYKLLPMARGVLNLIEKKKRESDFFGLHVNPYAALSGDCGLCLGSMGDFMEAELFIEKGLRQAISTNHLTDLARIEFQYGLVFHTKGNWKAAAEHLQKSIGYSEEVKFLNLLSWAWCFLGNTYAYLGDPETGRNYGEKGLKMQRNAGIEWFLSWQYLHLGDTYLQLGDLDNARASAEEALKLSQKNSERHYEGLARIFWGRILGRTEGSHIRKAEESILKGMKIADALRAKPAYAQGHLNLGELYANAGQKEKAIENLRKAEAMFQEMEMDYWLARTKKLLEMVRI